MVKCEKETCLTGKGIIRCHQGTKPSKNLSSFFRKPILLANRQLDVINGY